MLRKSSVNMESVNVIDLGRVSQRTEGFVARDLEAVVDRAIHAHLVSRGKGSRHTTGKALQLTDTDLDTGTNLSLIGVDILDA